MIEILKFRRSERRGASMFYCVAVSAVVCAVPLGGCGDPSTDTAVGGARVDTIGDTIFVVAPRHGEWNRAATLEQVLAIGELDGPLEYLFGGIVDLAIDAEGILYVLDRGAKQVRAFTSSGDYVRTYGRPGDGPGELSFPSGMAVLSDGRILVRDRGNDRIQVFGADGDPHDEWTHPYLPSGPSRIWTDLDDRVLVEVSTPPPESKGALLHFSGEGELLQMTPLPTEGLETFRMRARGRGTGEYTVPFTFSPQWALHPSGKVLVARGEGYELDLLAEDGSVLRIGREYDPVPVTEEERREAESRLITSMRRIDPAWRWDGPPIPEFKAPFNAIAIGTKGRIWVRLNTPTFEEENPHHDPSDPRSRRTVRRAERIFDVFEADGTYLGQVQPPPEFRTFTAIFDGDDVWTVLQDELGVEKVVLYRLQHPLEENQLPE